MYVLQLLASCLPTDRRVLAKIKELTKAGVHRATDMQPLIGDFVCNVLFAGQSEPPRYDSRFWPSMRIIRNCIYATKVRLAKYVDLLFVICFLVCPETIVFGRTYVLLQMFFFLSARSPRCVGRPA